MGDMLQLKDWQSASSQDRHDIAKQIESSTDGRFTFTKLQRFNLGAFSNEVAVFENDGAKFVFVPGADVQLGFDIDSFQMSEQQAASWEDTAEGYGLEQPWSEYAREFLSPVRSVCLVPMLVECVSTEVGIEPASVDAPDVREIIEQHGQRRKYCVTYNESIRVVSHGEGHFEAFRFAPLSHGELVEKLKRSGFRLPTSDEWEYICGGGSPALFRWGNDCPCNSYATDSKWNLHKQASQFGVHIAQDPYDYEVVAEPTILRGGDGGGTTCGGAGFFVGWLPLATSYVDPYISEHHNEDCVTGLFMRRVVSVTGL